MDLSVVFLQGKEVCLRPLEMSDAPTVTRWINDPQTRQWLGNVWPLLLHEEEAWIRERDTRIPRRDLVFAIIRTSDGRHVGNIGLHEIDWVNRRAVTGMLIGEADARGQGLGPKAKALLLDYAFHTLGLQLVCALTIAGNEASARSLLKSGYTQEARLRRRFFRGGVWHDECVFSITAEEWDAHRSG